MTEKTYGIAIAQAEATLIQLGPLLRRGDTSVLPEYRPARDTILSLEKAEVVRIPAASDMDAMWDAAGFPDVGGQPVPGEENTVWADGHREVTGVHRRLRAAEWSIVSRGTAEREFSLGSVGRDGSRAFAWESVFGTWGRRHWRITGRLTLVGGRLAAHDVKIAVESTARREEGVHEWTVFVGGALDGFIAARLTWVIAQFQARRMAVLPGVPENWYHTWAYRAPAGTAAPEGWVPVPLSEEEAENGWHDIYGGVAAEWLLPEADADGVIYVTLRDDDYGSARVLGPDGAEGVLVACYWAQTQ